MSSVVQAERSTAGLSVRARFAKGGFLVGEDATGRVVACVYGHRAVRGPARAPAVPFRSDVEAVVTNDTNSL